MDATLIRNLSDHRGNNLFHVCCCYGHLDCLQWLMQRGKQCEDAILDENKYELTPLVCAVKVCKQHWHRIDHHNQLRCFRHIFHVFLSMASFRASSGLFGTQLQGDSWFLLVAVGRYCIGQPNTDRYDNIMEFSSSHLWNQLFVRSVEGTFVPLTFNRD